MAVLFTAVINMLFRSVDHREWDPFLPFGLVDIPQYEYSSIDPTLDVKHATFTVKEIRLFFLFENDPAITDTFYWLVISLMGSRFRQFVDRTGGGF